MAVQSMSLHGAPEVFAKLGHEVGELDESDPGPPPKMIMNLGNRCDARDCILQRTSRVLGLRAGGLNAEQTNDRSKAVFYAVAHFAG
jgi:hypothetical protein